MLKSQWVTSNDLAKINSCVAPEYVNKEIFKH